ncbi:preprotein translocase subunit SecG [Thalassospira lucentensis]|mgnify:CR=1 FL=1|uniref:Protein-export membrane protein SecG n=3 Tax=Thalassospira TaxID=168934 RepID=A0A154L9P6_9PROT|nr:MULTISPECIES: preprotein translocase subunit SecG [Thalassospira]UKV16691.1 preprotein translocase subunit SecG [Thalassospiraceae bacterium SW-3-3]KZB67955.1 preprotein translocase subunit SecG [Thalassospira lucentensis]MAZ34493.1 preprotein translocase subunit SecG [Thalassospira sp.]MBO9508674.1 preprotein translocase subunit SecG [Thalassospira sp. A3_1]MCH2276803.1 preprotein translocase subunit SecG [Thalassospira sp.]
MQTVILVIHLLLALGMIAVILVQRSEGGGLGIGGSGGGGGGNFGVMSSRSAANLLTRTTAILAGAFMITSLALALLSNTHTRPTSILDQAPAPAAEQQPAEDTGPAAPTR